MIKTSLSLLLLSLFIAIPVAMSQAQPSQTLTGDDILHPAPLGKKYNLHLYKSDKARGGKKVVSLSQDDAASLKTTEALELSSHQRSLFWHVALSTGNFNALKPGDICRISFDARTLHSEQEDGNGIVMAYVQQNHRPFNPSVMETVTFGAKWTTISIPFRVQYQYNDKKDQFTLGLGQAVQTIQLVNIKLIRYPAGTRLRDIPVTSSTYGGREANAAWRTEAQGRINSLRRTQAYVSLVDANGSPLANTEVSVKMTKHAFTFGSAVRADLFTRDDKNSEIYKQKIPTYFNTVSIANGLKWGRWSTPAYREKTLTTLEQLKAQNLSVHGHVLVWPSWAKSRVDLKSEKAAALSGDVVPLRKRIDAHIKDITQATNSYIDHWDVMNEPWNNNDFMKLMGKAEMVSWFKQARTHAPHAGLFINDFGILSGVGAQADGHRDTYYEIIDYLNKNNAPLDAIGMQSHFGSGSISSIEDLQAILNRFAKLKKDIYITEYDFMTQDEALQGDFTRDFLTLAFSHPQVKGFILWGFWDGMHWRGNSAMYRKDWTLKPAGEAFVNLVKKEWWTDETSNTNTEGKAVVRAFYGEHTITYSHAGKTYTQAVTITPKQNHFTFTVK